MLKKYKDKLYTFLVLKNSAIASEYQSYVTADTERHEKHKIKSWIYLIKLNIKYRIFGGKPDKKSDNQPYIDGPESEVSSRPLPIHLAMKLMKYDVISFDIFDTLILRPFATPQDIFYLVGQKLQILDFKTKRIEAEKNARIKQIEQKGTREITIDDIYKELEYMGVCGYIDGMQTELEIEFEMCFANPYMKQVYDILVNANKQIYVTSDMYLPKKVMQQLLQKVGYNFFTDIIVSCDYGVAKHQKELFNHLKNMAGKNKTIIHIGDNYQSDIVAAKETSIDTYFYKGVNQIGNTYRTHANIPQLQWSINSGIVNMHLHNGTNNYSIYYEYGFKYGGQITLAYTNFLCQHYKDYKIDKLLLLARDCYIIDKILDITEPSINKEYCYYSRSLALNACFNENYASFMERILYDSLPERSNNGTMITIKNLLKEYNLECLASEIIKYGINDHTHINKDNINILMQFLCDYKHNITKLCQDKVDGFKKYLSDIIGESKRLSIVDIGWTGTTALQLKKFILKHFKSVEYVDILYYGYTKDNTSILNYDIHTFAFNRIYNKDLFNKLRGNNLLFFELLFSAPEPSIKRINSDLSFEFAISEDDNYKTINAIHKGIIDYVKIYNNFFYKYNIELTGNIVTYPFIHLMCYIDEYRKHFNDYKLSISSNFVGSELEIKSLKDVFNLENNK